MRKVIRTRKKGTPVHALSQGNTVVANPARDLPPPQEKPSGNLPIQSRCASKKTHQSPEKYLGLEAGHRVRQVSMEKIMRGIGPSDAEEVGDANEVW